MMESAIAAGQKLQALAGARSRQGLFLTVTLSTRRVDDWRQFAPTFLNSEFNRIIKERGGDKEEKHILASYLDQILDVFQYDVANRTQGLALFADGEPELLERIELPFPLINRVVLEPHPYVRPLVHALELMEPFIIARVTRDESSLFVVNAWGVASEDDLSGPWLKSSDRETGELSIKREYASARQDTLVELHFKDVAAALGKLLENSGARRVVLAAQHDIAVAFRKQVPQSVAVKIVAEMPFDAVASPGQMLAPARLALESGRHRELAEFADRISENLGAGGRAAAGFDDVMAALQRHQVQTLLVDRNYRPSGWHCAECDWVGLTGPAQCPLCGGSPVPIHDAVGELVRLAIIQNASVEVAEDLTTLTDLGGVAAVLRYA